MAFKFALTKDEQAKVRSLEIEFRTAVEKVNDTISEYDDISDDAQGVVSAVAARWREQYEAMSPQWKDSTAGKATAARIKSWENLAKDLGLSADHWDVGCAEALADASEPSALVAPFGDDFLSIMRQMARSQKPDL